MLLPAHLHGQRMGIKGGLNFSKIAYKQFSENLSASFCTNTGFHIGPFYEIAISDYFSLESALLLNSKGFRYGEDRTALEEKINYDHDVNLYYLDLPINLKGRYSFDYFSVFVSTGPYVGVGLFGKEKQGPTLNEQREEDVREIVWGDDPLSDFKRYDYGIQLGTGIEAGQLSLGVNYNYGLANISPDKINGLKINNRVINVSLAYTLLGK